MRARDHVNSHHFANSIGGFNTGFTGALYGSDIALDDDRDQTATHFILSHDLDVGGLGEVDVTDVDGRLAVSRLEPIR